MRQVVMGILVATNAVTASAQTCVQPPEREAFNTVALKSALMVGALSCNQQGAYNKFMDRFQPEVLSGQHVMDRYFAHAYGLYSQMQEDSYETTLANSQSEASIDIGANYCADTAQLYSQILALKTPEDLARFIATNPPVQPIALTICTGEPAENTIAAAANARLFANPPPEPAPARHAHAVHVHVVRVGPPPAPEKKPAPVDLASVSI